MKPRLFELGDSACTIQFGAAIDAATSDRVMAARDFLVAAHLPAVTDIVASYSSLTVHFDPLHVDRNSLAATLQQAASVRSERSAFPTRHAIPAKFGSDSGPDLDCVAAATGRSAREIVQALCAIELRVFMIGFLPGFPYMGELPEWLHLPRRATPRTAVPAGSVAIADKLVGIYPWRSPGGWHLVGRTDVPLFDVSDEQRPARLAPGDVVRLVPVDHD